MAGVWQLLDRRQPPLSNFIKGKAFREHTTLYKDFVMGKTLGREYILLGSQILNFCLVFSYSENCQTSWAPVIPWEEKEILKIRVLLEVWLRKFNYFAFNKAVTSYNPTLLGHLCEQGIILFKNHINTTPLHTCFSGQMKMLKEHEFNHFCFLNQCKSVDFFSVSFFKHDVRPTHVHWARRVSKATFRILRWCNMFV